MATFKDPYGIKDAIGDSPLGNEMAYSATLVKVTYANRVAATPTAGKAATETNYSCKVLFTRTPTVHGTQAEVYGKIGNSNKRDQDAVIKIVGKSLASGILPAHGDYIEVDSERYRIVGDVTYPPTGAMFACRCRLA